MRQARVDDDEQQLQQREQGDQQVVAVAQLGQGAGHGFLAGGGDGFAAFKEGTDRLSGGFDLDALVDYLAKNDPTAPPAGDRITGNGCAP